MSWEPRPLPDVTPESKEYWSAAANGRLLVRKCQDCCLVYHYPRALCPDCFSDNVEWMEASGKGEVYSYSVAQDINGWPEKGLPLVIGYIELDEGPRVMTNISGCDPEDVKIGTPVEVEYIETDKENIGVPVFTLK